MAIGSSCRGRSAATGERRALARDGAPARARAQLRGQLAVVLILAALAGRAAAIAPAQDPPPAPSREQEAYELTNTGRQALKSRAGQSLAEARRALEAAIAIPDTKYRPWAYALLASVERMEDRPWRGLELLRTGERLLEQLDQGLDTVPGTRRLLLHELVGCYQKLGLPDEASKYLAPLAAASAGSARARLEAAIAALDLQLALADSRLVRDGAEKALADPELRALGPDAVARLELRRLIAQRDLARGTSELSRVAEQLSELRNSALRAWLEAGDAWLEAGEHERAWRSNEDLLAVQGLGVKSKAEVLAQRAHIALLQGRDPAELVVLHGQLAGAVEQWLEEWRERPVRAGGGGALLYAANRSLLTALLALDRRVLDGDAAIAAAFSHLEAALALGTLPRRIGGPLATLADARRLAPAGGGVLMFVFGPWSGSLLLLDGDGAAHHTIELDRRFWRQADALRDALDRPPDGADVRALARQVADRVLPAAVRERVAGWQHAVLVGPELTARIFQALPWGDSWWCLERPLRHLPSVSVGMALQQRVARRDPQTSARLDLAVIGDPDIDEASAKRWLVESLDMSEARRAKFGEAFPEERRQAWWGREARPSVLRGQRVATANCLCLFTHGVNDYTRERSAGVLLAGEETGTQALFPDAVEQFRVPPLVLLGVCGAASGPARLGDGGANHLGGAFLLAGADCVALAHGDLSVGATRDLLAEALANWKRGDGIAEAMRKARARIAKDPDRAHPYFFAGLRVVGLDVDPPAK